MSEVVLSKNHTGMKISMSGVLRRKLPKVESEMIMNHLELLGKEYYSGNTAIVDEFLQLYCIAEDERKEVLKKKASVNHE